MEGPPKQEKLQTDGEMGIVLTENQITLTLQPRTQKKVALKNIKLKRKYSGLRLINKKRKLFTNSSTFFLFILFLFL
jgi:hypothetical protein